VAGLVDEVGLQALAVADGVDHPGHRAVHGPAQLRHDGDAQDRDDLLRDAAADLVQGHRRAHLGGGRVRGPDGPDAVVDHDAHHGGQAQHRDQHQGQQAPLRGRTAPGGAGGAHELCLGCPCPPVEGHGSGQPTRRNRF